MSAKILRVKQLQNQLTDTQNQLNELVNENRLLRTLQKRQAVALQRFEGSQDQLPQLIKSHNEEIRILNSKLKQIKEKYTDLENRLKRKDAELSYLKEHHKQLLHLSQDKQLADRAKLAKKVETLEAREKEQNEKIQLLTRKLELEGKNYRHQLNVETSKLKETQNDLKSALGTINNLKSALEAKEKYVNCTMPKKYQQTMDHLMQNTHVSLPIPPRVSIRQPDKYPDALMLNEDEYSSDSDGSYIMFEEKDLQENEKKNSIKQIENSKTNSGWNVNDQDSKSTSSNDNKCKGNNQSDDSLDGLKSTNFKTDGKKKKKLFTNVNGVGRENYSFGIKADARLKEKTLTRSNETLGRVKPRSRSMSRDFKNESLKAIHRVNPLKKGNTGKPYFADRESSSDERHKVVPIEKNKGNLDENNFRIKSSLDNFHREIQQEIDQVIRSEGSLDSEDIFENCEPSMDEIIPNKREVQNHIDSIYNNCKEGLKKYSNLSWEQMKNELPQSKDEIMNMLDKAHPDLSEDSIILDQDKKTSLLRQLNEIDNGEDCFDKPSISDKELGKISKTKKKQILQEIFK